MNELQRKWFFEEIKKNKGSDTEINKNDIFDFSQELGLNLKSNVAKAKIIDTIIENGFEEKFYDTFQEFMYVPEWDVREKLELSKKQFNELIELGIITERPLLKEFKGRSGRFSANAYPLSILARDKEELKELHLRAYSSNTFRVRIETTTLDEIKDIVEQLSSCFEVVEAPTPYEHRDKSGYYSYFRLRIITDDPLIKNVQLVEMAKLKMQVQTLKEQLSNTEIELRKRTIELIQLKEETNTLI